MLKKTGWFLVVLLLTVSIIWAASTDRWLHVRVEKFGSDSENVRINVPLAFVEKVLPLIQAEEFQHGKIQLAEKELNGVDLRGIVDAVSSLPDSEFVTVQTNHDTVRVAKANGYLLVRSEKEIGTQKVSAKIPMPVIQALLSGKKDELNVLAAIKALSAYGNTELIAVDDHDTRVRIWVDDRNSVR